MKTPLLRNFIFLSFLIVITYPVYLKYFFVPTISEYILENKEKDAIITAEYIASSLFNNSDIISRDLFTPDFVQKIQLVKQTFEMEKIKVFSKSGEIVYSTNPEDIGKINQHDYFFEIVSLGEIYSKMIAQSKSTLEGRIVFSDVVETYAPIMNNGKFRGAFEIYYDITEKKIGKPDHSFTYRHIFLCDYSTHRFDDRYHQGQFCDDPESAGRG